METVLRLSKDEQQAGLSQRAAQQFEQKDALAARDAIAARQLSATLDAALVKERLDHEMARVLQKTDDDGEYDIDQGPCTHRLERLCSADDIDAQSRNVRSKISLDPSGSSGSRSVSHLSFLQGLTGVRRHRQSQPEPGQPKTRAKAGQTLVMSRLSKRPRLSNRLDLRPLTT